MNRAIALTPDEEEEPMVEIVPAGDPTEIEVPIELPEGVPA